MTPPPAATHAAGPTRLATSRAARPVAATAVLRLLDAGTWPKVRALTDIVVLYLAASAAIFASSTVRVDSLGHWLSAAFPLIVVGLIHARRSPDDRLSGSAVDTCVNVIGVVSLGAMLLVAAESILGGSNTLDLALRLWLFSVFYLGMGRVVLLSIRRQAARNGTLATPTLVVGAGQVGERLVKRLFSEPAYGLRPVGFVDSDPLPRSAPRESHYVPVLGGLSDLDEAIDITGARRVILAFSSEPDQALVQRVRRCQERGVEVSLVPRLFESINERAALDHVGGLPLLTLRPTNPLGWQFTLKHGFDRVFAFVAIVALGPLMIACALAVRFSSPGPILFRQRRVGRDGHEFTMLKFRTMRGDPTAAGEADAMWAAEIRGESPAPLPVAAEDRTTRVGEILRAASLDELPQLFNILNGDMSVVGPRPERVGYVREFERIVSGYGDRHRVKSGMTGWAQVNGLRGQTSIVDRVEWDNYYIQNWSLRLDLRILALTVAELLRFRG